MTKELSTDRATAAFNSSDWLAAAVSLSSARVLIGERVNLPNGWSGGGEVIGALKTNGRVRLLIAWPYAENAEHILNERAESVAEANEVAEGRRP